jgi:hypothetical protein
MFVKSRLFSSFDSRGQVILWGLSNSEFLGGVRQQSNNSPTKVTQPAFWIGTSQAHLSHNSIGAEGMSALLAAIPATAAALKERNKGLWLRIEWNQVPPSDTGGTLYSACHLTWYVLYCTPI